jgi:hypothetical protein
MESINTNLCSYFKVCSIVVVTLVVNLNNQSQKIIKLRLT